MHKYIRDEMLKSRPQNILDCESVLKRFSEFVANMPSITSLLLVTELCGLAPEFQISYQRDSRKTTQKM